MNESNALGSPNPFYDYYKNYGIMPLAVPAISIMLIIDVTGIIANLTVIFVTYKTKSLRSTANFLICGSCLFDSIHVTSHFYLGFVIYSGKNFIDIIDCFYINIIPLSGLFVGTCLIFIIALDRLISVIIPRFHTMFNKFVILAFWFFLCGVYAGVMLYLGYKNALQQPDAKVVCLIVEAIHGPISDLWSLTTCIFILSGVLCYAIIGICIKFKIGKTDTTKKLLKSLVILTLIMLCSWFFTSASMILVSVWKLPEQYAFFVPLYTGITINAACAANFFILYKFSSEYNSAIRNIFSKSGIVKVQLTTTTKNSKISKVTVTAPGASVSQIQKF